MEKCGFISIITGRYSLLILQLAKAFLVECGSLETVNEINLY